LANCLRCGKELPSITFGRLSGYCADCHTFEPAQPKPEISADVPELGLSPVPWPIATYLLLAINCGVFVAMVATGISPITPTTDQLLRWGADYGPYTLSGQYWRAITASFLHIGIVHLLGNMWFLWRLGRILERLVGAGTTGGIYLLTGVGAEIFSLSWEPMRVSAGASGAIFGFIGVLISLLYCARIEIPNERLRKLRSYVVRLAIYNLLFGFIGPIDNMAHLGGLVTGLIMGYLIARSPGSSEERFSRQKPVMAGTAIVLVLLFVHVTRTKAYAAEMQRGNSALKHSDYATAIQDFQRYTRARENDAYGHAQLGYALQKAERLDDAAREYERALALEPDYPVVRLDLAEIYASQGKDDKAVPLFTASIEQVEPDADAYLQYGRALRSTGNYPGAEKALRKSLELDPKNQEAQLELKMLETYNQPR
jgi:rhomboid protease GluP